MVIDNKNFHNVPEMSTETQHAAGDVTSALASAQNGVGTNSLDGARGPGLELSPETSSIAGTDHVEESISSLPLADEAENQLTRRTGFSHSNGELGPLQRSHQAESNGLPPEPSDGVAQTEAFVKKVRAASMTHHHTLPDWLKDNDFLLRGHRAPTNSFAACFKSIFRIHTETGNIWTHLLGMIAFLTITVNFLSRPPSEVQWQEKAAFSPFFIGAILCLGFSWTFHTCNCHSQAVGSFFHKLDYCGISVLIIGSFVPWLHYSFYCRLAPKATYLALIVILGTICIVISMWNKFAHPQYRPLRAGVFIALGLSGVVPAMHFVITDGFWHAVNDASLGWLVLMAVLYIVGALIYAARIPERIFPGKFDIWFQSHQIFHVFVVIAAFVHYHGMSEIANFRLTQGRACLASEIQ